MKTPLFTGVISFSTKEKGALNILGINTVEDFLALDLEKIRNHRGYGQGTINRLAKLKKKGIHKFDAGYQ